MRCIEMEYQPYSGTKVSVHSSFHMSMDKRNYYDIRCLGHDCLNASVFEVSRHFLVMLYYGTILCVSGLQFSTP